MLQVPYIERVGYIFMLQVPVICTSEHQHIALFSYQSFAILSKSTESCNGLYTSTNNETMSKMPPLYIWGQFFEINNIFS